MGSINFIIAIFLLCQIWMKNAEEVGKEAKHVEHKESKNQPKQNAKDHQVQGVLGWAKDKVKTVFSPEKTFLDEKRAVLKELEANEQNLDLNQRICKFLLERLSDDQSVGGSGMMLEADGVVSPRAVNNVGSDRCANLIADKHNLRLMFAHLFIEKIRFEWNYSEDQEQELFNVLLFGGQLLTKLDIYGRHFKYSATFFDNLVEKLISNPDAYHDMIADANVCTPGMEPVEWPKRVKDILSMEEVQKIKRNEQRAMELGQGVRVLIENHSEGADFGTTWWGIVYIVEKNGKKLFKFALVNEDAKYIRTCDLGKFVEFRLIKM